ncbi:MAG: hypothetical protein ACI4GD_03645 [Lachnospiraceae bacterium]
MKNTKKKAYILNQKIDHEFNAAGKAMRDVFKVFTDNGVKIMPGVPKTAPKYLKALDIPILMWHIWFVLKPGDYCIFSFPENKLKIKLLDKFAKKRNIKTVCFVNDINSIRGGDFDKPEIKEWIKKDMELIGSATIILAPNVNSKQFLEEQGVTSQIITVGTWDYIIDDNDFPIKCRVHTEGEKWQIAFAGNLNKAEFISKLDEVKGDNIFFKLWGNCDRVIDNSRNHEHMGSVSPEELPHYVTACHFGLVWDGDGVHELSGGLGEYLRYNNSHKCGLYLACGLPVFVWKNAGLSDFVIENKCGFVIDNLDEISTILDEMTETEYQELLSNVKKVSENVKKGYYLKNALNEMFSS